MERIIVKVISVYRDGGTIECECVKTGEQYTRPYCYGIPLERGQWYKGDLDSVYDEEDNEVDDKEIIIIYDSSVLIDTVEVKAQPFFDHLLHLQMHVVDRFLNFPERFKIVNTPTDATDYIHENEKIFSRADVKNRIKELLNEL